MTSDNILSQITEEITMLKEKINMQISEQNERNDKINSEHVLKTSQELDELIVRYFRALNIK